MKILHITPHLGGGVGKAHSALRAVEGREVDRHYLLLEEPRDARYADAIRASGACVSLADDPADMRSLAAHADIVQIEWWNHPRLYEWLCRADLPEACTVIWSHISGLSAPHIPAALLTAPHRFLFTSACSLEAPNVRGLRYSERDRPGVINSGFGFDAPPSQDTARLSRIAYLGTVDFAKMSPLFFDVVDRANLDHTVAIWGSTDPDGEPVRAAAAMHRPDSIHFHGHADDPETVLRQSGIFLYLLQPEHFGTAENALIEAMSTGAVPLVFDNPAERAIVEHGRTGFIENSVEAAAERLRWMLAHPAEIARMGRQAAEVMAATRSASQSAAAFAALYHGLLPLDKERIDYPALLGSTPAEWFLSTQPPCSAATSGEGPARKGTLAHFTHCFPDDPSLQELMASL